MAWVPSSLQGCDFAWAKANDGNSPSSRQLVLMDFDPGLHEPWGAAAVCAAICDGRGA
jgi:hypothetical protein